MLEKSLFLVVLCTIKSMEWVKLHGSFYAQGHIINGYCNLCSARRAGRSLPCPIVYLYVLKLSNLINSESQTGNLSCSRILVIDSL